MSHSRPAHQRDRVARGLGILFVILGLVHTPLPEPDYHNIRHHDGPGEVCDHHDHLLRWHPKAGVDDDVSVLHWHWFYPAADPFDMSPEHAGSALHAHNVDWQVSTWDDGPRITVDTTSRLGVPPESSPVLTLSDLLPLAHSAVLAPRDRRERTFGATFAPRAHLTSLYHRWSC